MFTKLFSLSIIISSLTLSTLTAEIVETDQIETILPAIEQDTLVLFNIAEVLTDSEISLGSSPWRAYLREQAPNLTHIPYHVHDKLTWLAFNCIPHKPVETITPAIIQYLQEKEIAVAAFTSRGRTEWYSTEIQGVDEATENVLSLMFIDFAKSSLPFVFIQMEGNPYLLHYRNGIFYSNHMKKGDFLKQLLEDSGYKPSSVVFVDDKRDSLESVEAALKELNIPFHGFWYTHTKKDRINFSPMVANIQLEALIKNHKLLSDKEAQDIVESDYQDVDPDRFFLDLINSLDEKDLQIEHKCGCGKR
jgi:hypothetical protein